MNCANCGATLPPPPWNRRDTCPGCGSDLHACVRCSFFAPGHYNNCREPQAERVLDPDKANFCDYFRPAEAGEAAGTDPRAEAKARLDALFRKR